MQEAKPERISRPENRITSCGWVHSGVLAGWGSWHQLIQKCQTGPGIEQEPHANPGKGKEQMGDSCLVLCPWVSFSVADLRTLTPKKSCSLHHGDTNKYTSHKKKKKKLHKIVATISPFTDKETTASGWNSLGAPWGPGPALFPLILSAPPPTCTGMPGYNLPWMGFRLLKRFCVVRSLGGFHQAYVWGLLVSFQRVQNTHHAVKMFYCPDIRQHPAHIFKNLST